MNAKRALMNYSEEADVIKIEYILHYCRHVRFLTFTKDGTIRQMVNFTPTLNECL